MTCTEVILGLIIIWVTLSALLCIVLQSSKIKTLIEGSSDEDKGEFIAVNLPMPISPKQYYIKEWIPEYNTWDDVEDLHEFTASDIVDFADEYISKQWTNVDCDSIVEVKRKKDSGVNVFEDKDVNVKTEASERDTLIS